MAVASSVTEQIDVVRSSRDAFDRAYYEGVSSVPTSVSLSAGTTAPPMFSSSSSSSSANGHGNHYRASATASGSGAYSKLDIAGRRAVDGLMPPERERRFRAAAPRTMESL